MKKVCCMIMFIGVVFVGALQAAAATYKLGMLPLIGWAEYRVAQVKGFWEKQGVHVELFEYASPIDHRRGYEQNRFELAPVPLASTANLRNTGLSDVIYLGTMSVADHHKYLILKNDLLRKSLKGQTIGVFAIDAGNMFLLTAYLKSVNTRLADVRLVEMSPNDEEANFIAGRLQAVLALDRGNQFYEPAKGVIALSTRDFYEPHGLFVRKSFLEKISPEDLKKILRGCVEAIQWIRDPANWEEYKGILKQYFLADQPDLSDDQMRALVQEGKFFDPQTLLVHNQQQLTDYFTQFRAFLVTEGILKADVLNAFTQDDVIKNQALIEVLQTFGK